MDFATAIDNLKREINVIFDDDAVRGIDLYAKRGLLTYLVGNVNSIALKEATGRFTKIDRSTVARIKCIRKSGIRTPRIFD